MRHRFHRCDVQVLLNGHVRAGRIQSEPFRAVLFDNGRRQLRVARITVYKLCIEAAVYRILEGRRREPHGSSTVCPNRAADQTLGQEIEPITSGWSSIQIFPAS